MLVRSFQSCTAPPSRIWNRASQHPMSGRQWTPASGRQEHGRQTNLKYFSLNRHTSGTTVCKNLVEEALENFAMCSHCRFIFLLNQQLCVEKNHNETKISILCRINSLSSISCWVVYMPDDYFVIEYFVLVGRSSPVKQRCTKELQLSYNRDRIAASPRSFKTKKVQPAQEEEKFLLAALRLRLLFWEIY